jgi:hypothetical protein
MRIEMMTTALVSYVLVAAFAASGADDNGLRAYAAALRTRAEQIRQSPAELRWQTIPWLTDLNEGLKQARAEQRPLLLWTTGDDPLGRC